MANPPCLKEDSIKYNKSKYHTQKPKALSFFASILSLIIYIFLFYIFNLSPYNLFNNNIFWFLMSNNLILIIAADYRAFSSSKQKQDLYKENVKHSQTKNHVSSSHVPKYQQVNEKCINPKQVLGGELQLQGNKDTITQNIEVPERVLEIVAQNDPKKLTSDQYSNEKRSLLLLEVDEISYKACEVKPIPARINYQRSKSDRPCRVKRVVIEERMNRMRRSETIKVEAKVEENEFTTMTNEELNRRVEEFIHKFHRQIRLQATILSNR